MHNKVLSVLHNSLDTSIYEFGLADLSGLLSDKYAEYISGISILRKLDDKIINEIADGPTTAYYNHYNEVNRELNTQIETIVQDLSLLPIRACAIKATAGDAELNTLHSETLTCDVSHKMIATRAGLGWIGKTDLLVSKRFGPRIRLASILTDYSFSNISTPIDTSQCGSCTVCVDKCPAQASNGKLWNISVHRNDFFNPFLCREYCLSVSKEKLNARISLCGKCVHICPRG